MQSPQRILSAMWAPLIAAVLLVAAPCRAANYALIIGIDEYKQSDRISTLGGAKNDAQALAKTLTDASGFPAANVRLLVSNADPEPTATNILAEVDRLAQKTHPGDTVWFLYSGHGVELDGTPYLVPWDADAHDEDTLKASVLPTSVLRQHLAKIPAKALLLTFDMCRNDPRKGSRDLSSNNYLGANQARDLRLVPSKDKTRAQDVVTFYACSEGERSWEWHDKQRGFFSYYLEQGLRHDAADSQGVVRVSNLVSYVQKAVYGAVQREEGVAQTPLPQIEGQNASDVVLARGLAPASGGATAANPATQGQYEAALQQGYELFQQQRWPDAQAKFQVALGLQADSAKAANGLGRAYRAQNNMGQAETYFRQAVRLDPNNSYYADDLGVLLEAQKDTREAEDLYRKAVAANPNNIAPVLHLAALRVKAKNGYDEAVRLLLTAMDIDPKNPVPVDMLGNIYFDRKMFDSAEQKYQRAVRLDVGNPTYVGHLAKCLVREGKVDQAHAIVDQARASGLPVSDSVFDVIDKVRDKIKIPKIGGFHF